MDSGEAIATMCADMAAGRLKLTSSTMGTGLVEETGQYAMSIGMRSTVVDATAIWQQLMQREEPADLYGHVLAPPWDDAVIGFVNGYGNVHLMHVTVGDPSNETLRWDVAPEVGHSIPWDECRWVILVSLWLGGRDGTGRAVTATGPMFMWSVAVAADGTPLDIHWLDPVKLRNGKSRREVTAPPDEWTNAQLTWMATLNFMNCRNVDIVEPTRNRPLRRRIARTGVRVHTLSVFPTGRSTRTATGDPFTEGVALTSVRGHFATYGTEGRGLLFGKYSGRFFRPQHARGSAEHGTVDKTYRPQP